MSPAGTASPLGVPLCSAWRARIGRKCPCCNKNGAVAAAQRGSASLSQPLRSAERNQDLFFLFFFSLFFFAIGCSQWVPSHDHHRNVRGCQRLEHQHRRYGAARGGRAQRIRGRGRRRCREERGTAGTRSRKPLAGAALARTSPGVICLLPSVWQPACARSDRGVSWR